MSRSAAGTRSIASWLSTALCVAIVGFALAPSSASALDALACRGSGVQTYRPGITNSVAPVNVTDRSRLGTEDNPLVPCVALGSTVTGGHVDLAYQRPLSCTNPFTAGPPAPVVMSWDNGRSSTFTNSQTITQANGQAIVTGTGRITAGLYQGSAAVVVITFTQLSAGELLACASPTGLTTTNSTVALTIL